MQRELVYLLDMLQSAQMIRTFVEDMDQPAFKQDIKTQDAVIRRIEVIGEPSGNSDNVFEQRLTTEIPWQQIAGMRSKIDPNASGSVAVWEVAQRDIPALIAQIEPSDLCQRNRIRPSSKPCLVMRLPVIQAQRNKAGGLTNPPLRWHFLSPLYAWRGGDTG